MANKTAKNLLGDSAVYNRYFGDFRGVDFSSDHTQVHEQRLAYLCNMYRDYSSGQGQALETIPGFRRRVNLPDGGEVYGIHRYGGEDGKILLHAGKYLYLWHNYPLSINVDQTDAILLPEPSSVDQHSGQSIFYIPLEDNVAKIIRVINTMTKEPIGVAELEGRMLKISSLFLREGDSVTMVYHEGTLTAADAIYADMAERESRSFMFNNRLYLIDGKNYLVYDGESLHQASDNAYVPTTYINIIPSGENADIGQEYEQRNLLTPAFKHTFIADGATKEFYMNEAPLDGIRSVKVYGEELAEDAYTADLAKGLITFTTAPKKPQDADYPEFHAGVEIVAEKAISSVSGITEDAGDIPDLISACRICAIFDNRVFLSGNPKYPNHIFWCSLNSTGYADPTYFSVLNYVQDGVDRAPVTGLVPVADSLMVLKADTVQDGSVYFHTPMDTGEDLHPRTYPSTRGLAGIGCLGASLNFLDDPVFVSRLGVEGVGQLSVRYERAIEHRSSLVDAKLVNTDLQHARLCEWNGYLVLLVDGCMYLADSRQRYEATGGMQYEWYYCEGIEVYEGQYPEFVYAKRLYREHEGMELDWCPACGRPASQCTCADGGSPIKIPLVAADNVYDGELYTYRDLTGQVVNPPDEDGLESADVWRELVTAEIEGSAYRIEVYYTVHPIIDAASGEVIKYEALLCEAPGNSIGGARHPAKTVTTIDSNLFFGTDHGVICSFNFDQRQEDGSFPFSSYHFDGRTILSGCATRMDNCGIPHLTKNTVKKSTVVKTRSFRRSSAKIKVRTNQKPYAQIARINSTVFDFESVDFTDFSFVTLDQSLFAVREKEKKWVEKQYYVYSDEYMKPFSLYYISYRYRVAGRYKQ